MATINDQSTLVGNFKEQYGDSIIEAFGFVARLAKAIPFNSEYASLGSQYVVPVDLELEHGFTATAGGTTPTSTSYLDPVTGTAQKATVDGYNLHGRTKVAYEAIWRSVGNKRAFKQSTEWVVRKLGLSGSKRLETMLLHGREGIATSSSLAAEAGAGPYTTIITISDATWAAGIWAGGKGAYVDLYSAATGGTFRNGASLAVQVSAIDTANKTVTITYATARAAWSSPPQNGDVLYWRTQSGTTEFPGLGAISSNTSTLHGIDAAAYELWAGNVVSSVGTPTFAKLLDAMAGPASYGLAGLKSVAVVSPKCFEVLNSDQAALRRFDVSYRPATAESGSEGLMYHSQAGVLEVMPHAFQKDGQINIFVPDEAERIGATDLTMVDKTEGKERIIFDSYDSPSKEMRIYSNQALFVRQPRHTVKMTGITY